MVNIKRVFTIALTDFKKEGWGFHKWLQAQAFISIVIAALLVYFLPRPNDLMPLTFQFLELTVWCALGCMIGFVAIFFIFLNITIYRQLTRKRV